ncbi:MAG: type II toxin-antitoxin system VapB family antitoxin [Pseudomonadota bacterium]|nr:type II toxin-antitoxin system VapB family antitoxin [Pseudomonadota bacterium]
MKTAKLFENGRSQAVRLPKEFRLPGKEVLIRRDGNRIILEPVETSFDGLVRSLDEFPEDFLSDGRQQPAMQPRVELP